MGGKAIFKSLVIAAMVSVVFSSAIAHAADNDKTPSGGRFKQCLSRVLGFSLGKPNELNKKNARSLEEKSTISPVAGAPLVLKNETAPKFIPNHKYDASTLERRVFAVHATEFFPADGVIHAGASDISGSSASLAEEPPSFRPTTHWALGELVRAHRISWEDRPYAVILPLGALKEQLININAYDTFTLGDFRLPQGAIFVMPKGSSQRVPSGAKIEVYGPGTSLRDAVDHAVGKYGGWHAEMKVRSSPGLDSIAEVEGSNINTADFFESILRENPRVSFGVHIQSQRGFAHRLGGIEQSVNYLMKQYGEFSPQQSTEEMVFLRRFIDHHLVRLDHEIRSAGFPETSLATYNEKVVKLREWLNIIDADLELRNQHKVTISDIDPKIMRKIRSLRGDPQALRKYIHDNLEQNRLNRRVRSEPISPVVAKEYLSGTPLTEARELMAFIAERRLMSASDLQKAQALYALKRTLELDLSQAEKEGLLDILRSSFESLEDSSKAMGSAMDVLAEFLDYSSARLPTALKILETREIRQAFEGHYGFQIPNSNLTLDGLFRIHPETKMMFKPNLTAGATAGHTILQKLGVLTDGVNPGSAPTTSFIAARYQARSIKFLSQSYAEYLGQVRLPMNTIRDVNDIMPGTPLKFYERMKRGDYGTAVQIWQKLGLRVQFHRMFPREVDFWRSPLSFEEIYLQLSREIP